MIKEDDIKLDQFIQWDYKVFGYEIGSFPRHIKWGYYCAITKYWDKKCVGLKNDDMYLRSYICEYKEHETDEWKEGKPIIFGQFFFLERSLWHQNYARTLFQEKINKSKKWREQTKAANEANAIKHAQNKHK